MFDAGSVLAVLCLHLRAVPFETNHSAADAHDRLLVGSCVLSVPLSSAALWPRYLVYAVVLVSNPSPHHCLVLDSISAHHYIVFLYDRDP